MLHGPPLPILPRATAHAPLPPSLSPSVMALRVGIIGTGWGLKVQVPQFRAAGLEISAIYSRSPDRAQAIAEEHAIPHAFSSIDDLVNSEAVDLVSVVGPTHERHSAVLKACEAGKHVLSEKPMALNAQQV